MKTEELIDMMADAITGEQTPIKCPKCEAEFHIALETTWKPHLMTVTYALAEGHKMVVEEFSASIAALSKALKSVGREMGVNAQVMIHELKTTESSVSVTVGVAAQNSKRKSA